MAKLNKDEISSHLSNLEGWQLVDELLIRKKYEFKGFKSAMFFVNAVAFEAEKVSHHPDFTVSWNKVTMDLTTHDAGGLTNKDFSLAQQIDALI